MSRDVKYAAKFALPNSPNRTHYIRNEFPYLDKKEENKTPENSPHQPDRCQKNLEIKIEDLVPPVPPDGGWAWCVLLGSFMCMFFVDGLTFSYGIMLTELETSFGASKTQVSLAGSLLLGFTLMSGPIVSALSNQVSIRVLVICGSIASSLAVFISSFLYDINSFILMYGVISGFSFGFIYLPAMTVVSQWFQARRATATGISVCGSSIGTTVYNILVPRLLKAYTWRGCFLILSAISLNCVAAGALFISLRDHQELHTRPPQRPEVIAEARGDKPPHKGHEGSESIGLSLNQLPPRLSNNSASKDLESGKRFVSRCRSRTLSCKVFLPLPLLEHESSDAVGVIDATVDDTWMPNGRFSASNWNRETLSQLQSLTSVKNLAANSENSQYILISSSSSFPARQVEPSLRPPIIGLAAVSRVVEAVIEDRDRRPGSRLGRACCDNLCRLRTGEEPHSPANISVRPTDDASLYIMANHTGTDMLFASAVSLKPSADSKLLVDEETRREIVKGLNREIDRPIHRKDIFYSGSIIHINEIGQISERDDYIHTMTSVREEEVKGNHVLNMLLKLFDFSLFKSPTFILLIASSIMGMCGFLVPYIFLKDNAQTLGYSEEESGNLFVYMGAVNTVFRVFAGWLSDRPCTDALFVNNSALIISGLACILLPLLTSYAGQVTFAVTYGGAIAAFVCLRVVLVVDILGLDRLTNAFGFLLLFQGISIIISPPLLGSFYETFKDFKYTFTLGGSALIVSAMLSLPLRKVMAFENRRLGRQIRVADDDDGNIGGPKYYMTRFLRRLRDRFLSLRRRCSKSLSA